MPVREWRHFGIFLSALSGRKSIEAQVIAHQPAEPRLRGTQEGLRGLSDPRAVYSEQVGADDQAAFAARGVGPDAGGESFISGEAGHQDEAASDGAFFCQRDMV